MKPRKVYTLSTNQKVHQIIRDAFHPPGYVCEVLSDFKTLLEKDLQPPDVLNIDLTTYPKARIIEFSLKYFEMHPDLLVNLIVNRTHLDILKKLPRNNVFDLLFSPITAQQARFLADRLEMFISLREKLEHLTAERDRIVSKLPVPVLVISSNLSFSSMNRSARKLFGIAEDPSSRELSVDTFIDCIVPRDRRSFAEALRRAFSAGLTTAIRVEIKQKGHRPAVVPLKIFPSWSDPISSGEPEVYIVANYEELFLLDHPDVFQKEKLAILGELSAEIAHEIRNSLMSIGGFVQIMEPENQKEGKETILAEVKRLERFLTSVREYTRPAMDIRNTDLKELIVSILELMGPELKKHGISYRFSTQREGESIETSPDILKQVIINLIRNATHAMPGGGNLEIMTFSAGEEVAISITDQGTGIREPQESLFVPISRGGKSIGLPVSHKLVKRLGGSISLVSSESGTTFTLRLPRRYSHHVSGMFQGTVRYQSCDRTECAKERRSDRRFSVSLSANCRFRNAQVKAHVLNLSRNGLLFKMGSRNFETDEPERIEFDIHSVHTGDVNRVSARIIPVRRERKKGETFIGCRIEPDERVSQFWNRYIRELHLYHANC